MAASGHCSSDQGTIVLGTLHPRSESQALLGSVSGLNRPDRQRVGRGKPSSGRGRAIARVARALGCAPWPPSQPRALSARPPSWDEKTPWFPMLYLYHICWYAVFTYALWCFRPNPALVSAGLAPGCSHSGGIPSSWDKALCWWGGQRAWWEEAMNVALGWAKVLFLVCLIGVSWGISVFHLALCSKHRERGSVQVWMSIRWEGGWVVLQEPPWGSGS